MYNKDKALGLTLVELIIAISILAILSTIGFFSYYGKISETRDATRISELNSIAQILELYFIDNGTFPIPDNSREISYSGSLVWRQGSFGDSVFKKVRRLSEKPLDPALNIEYSYSLINNKKEYELGTIFENNIVSIPSIQQTYANEIKAYKIGNYNERFSSINSGSVSIFLAIPSITSSDNQYSNLTNIIANNAFVVSEKRNLPANYNNEKNYNQTGLVQSNIANPVIFSGNKKELQTYSERKKFLENLLLIYQNSEALSDKALKKYQRIQEMNLNDTIIVNEFFEKIMIE